MTAIGAGIVLRHRATPPVALFQSEKQRPGTLHLTVGRLSAAFLEGWARRQAPFANRIAVDRRRCFYRFEIFGPGDNRMATRGRAQGLAA
jgi:hypothetical protein